MRILHVLTTDQRRGAELSAVTLQAEFRRRGHHADAVALVEARDGTRLEGVGVLGQRRLGPATLLALRRAAAGADLVIAHGSSTLPACALALRSGGPPFVYANIGDPLYWARTRLRRLRVRLLLGSAAGVAARSNRSLEVLRDVFGVPEDRLRVIPNGRDVRRFPAVDPSTRASARARLGLQESSEVVVCLGALSPEKRVDLAIRAVRDLDVVLVIAGEGPDRVELEALADMVAPGRVRFLGQVPDVPEVLAACDVLVLTSDSEGLPGALIEAGLTGLPVVATDVGYVRDIVDEGVTGLVVPRGDADAVAAALKHALAARQEMGQAARRRCLEHFDMTAVAARWEDLAVRSAARIG